MGKAAMLILTYHHVWKSLRDAPRDFYSVDAEQLRSHLDVLASHGSRPGSLADFLAGTAAPRDYLCTFDDGTSDHYDVVHPLLSERDHRAVFFVPTARIDQPGGMTSPQVRALAAAGHEI